MASLVIYFAGHLHYPVTGIDQCHSGCTAPRHVESQRVSDAAGGAGDNRNMSFNRLHIDGAGRLLKRADFVVIEARLLDGATYTRFHTAMYRLLRQMSSFFLRLHHFFCICEKGLTPKLAPFKINREGIRLRKLRRDGQPMDAKVILSIGKKLFLVNPFR